MNRIKLIQGDLTKCQVGAIVNAANSSLLGGGGVDGAIHSAAGPELLAECRTLGGCPTGLAKITKGYRLPAKFVIHTVGPIWDASRQPEMEHLLADCYRNSLALAVENGVGTIAFPNISTGVFHFPKNLAAEVAIRTVQAFLAQNESIEEVTFVCFDDENYQLYRRVLGNDF